MSQQISPIATPLTSPKTYLLTILGLVFAGIFTILHNFFLFLPLDTPATYHTSYNVAQSHLAVNSQVTPIHALSHAETNTAALLPTNEFTINTHTPTPVDSFTVVTPTEQSLISLEKPTTAAIATTRTTTDVDNTYLPLITANYLTIGNRTTNIFYVDNNVQSFPDSGAQVAIYRDTFLYAHSTGPFSNLAAQPDGTTFTVTLNNVTHHYVFDHQETLTVDEANAKRNTIYYAEYSPIQISLMTCAGVYDYNTGTYTHRLIRYARLID